MHSCIAFFAALGFESLVLRQRKLLKSLWKSIAETQSIRSHWQDTELPTITPAIPSAMKENEC